MAVRFLSFPRAGTGMSHSTKGEEFLTHAKILAYFILVEISCFWKFVLIKLFNYLTFTTVTRIPNIGVHKSF